MRAMGKPRNEDNIMQCSGKVGKWAPFVLGNPIHPLFMPRQALFFSRSPAFTSLFSCSFFQRFCAISPGFFALLAPCTHRSHPTGAR